MDVICPTIWDWTGWLQHLGTVKTLLQFVLVLMELIAVLTVVDTKIMDLLSNWIWFGVMVWPHQIPSTIVAFIAHTLLILIPAHLGASSDYQLEPILEFVMWQLTQSWPHRSTLTMAILLKSLCVPVIPLISALWECDNYLPMFVEKQGFMDVWVPLFCHAERSPKFDTLSRNLISHIKIMTAWLCSMRLGKLKV